MFLKGNTRSEGKTASLYEVEDTITFQLGENNFTSKGSYFLLLGKSQAYSNQIVLNRSSFKIDDKEVEKKFSKISNLYFSSLFPMTLTYDGTSYRIAHYNETAKRIMEKDLAIKNNYTGDGLDYIRGQFMDKVKNQTEFQQFLEQLPLYQVLNIGAYPKFKKEQFNFKWNIAGLGVIQATGNFKLDADNNKTVFTLENVDKLFIAQLLQNYISENGIQMVLNNDDSIEVNFKTETAYTDSFTAIQNAKAEFSINVNEKFKYTQSFFLTLSPTNN